MFDRECRSSWIGLPGKEKPPPHHSRNFFFKNFAIERQDRGSDVAEHLEDTTFTQSNADFDIEKSHMNTAPCFRLLIVLTMMSWGPSVFSQEVREFVVPNGKSLLGIQFKHGGNTVAELFPSPPEGLLIFTYDCGYYDNQFAFGKWVHPEQTLEPGQGVMIDNPGDAFTLSFLTEEIVTSWDMKIRAGKNLLVLPESGMDSINFRSGDQTLQFSLDTYTWRYSTFDDLDQA
jgi:hypothetical protein